MRPIRLVLALVVIALGALIFAADGGAAVLPAGWSSAQLEPQGSSLVSCASKSFCLTAGGQDTYIYNGRSWSRFTRADPLGDITAVTCHSSQFCVVGDSRGDVAVKNGSAWGSPEDVTGGASITSVSCPTASFCAVADSKGAVATFDGTDWTTPEVVDPGAQGLQVSCYAANACVATDAENKALMLRKKTWSKPIVVDAAGGGIRSISCTSSTFCEAVDRHRHVLSFNGKSWTKKLLKASGPGSGHASGTATSISCISGRQCAATGAWDYGPMNGINVEVWVLKSGTWKGFVWGEDAQPLASCTTGGYCMVFVRGETTGSLTTKASGLSAERSNWVSHGRITGLEGGYLSTISCGSSAFCMADGFHAYGTDDYVFNGSSWKRAAPMPSEFGGNLTEISCVAGGFCAGVEDGVGVAIYKDGKWSSVADHKTYFNYYGISCATSSFCVANTVGGDLVYNGSQWTAHKLSFQLLDIACVSESFCAGLSGDGQLYEFNGTEWSQPAATDPIELSQMEGFSCSSSSFCMETAGVSNGSTTTDEDSIFNGTSWSTPQEIGPTTWQFAGIQPNNKWLSCDADGDCLFTTENADLQPVLVAYRGGTWTPETGIGTEALSCAPDGGCASAGGYDGDATWSADPF